MPWYIAKKKTERKWQAYELFQKPELKDGYEMKGPFDNLVQCLIAANRDNDKGKRSPK